MLSGKPGVITMLSSDQLSKLGVPPLFQRAYLDWDEFSDRDQSSIRDFLSGARDAHPKQLGLFFSGGNGVGKTHTACAIIRTLLGVGLSCFRAEETDLIAEFTENRWKVPPRYYSAHVLCLDELGKAPSAGKTEESLLIPIVERVIKWRFEHLRPTIIVSNLSLANVAKVYDNTLASVIAGNCRPVRFPTVDRRRSKPIP